MVKNMFRSPTYLGVGFMCKLAHLTEYTKAVNIS